MFTPHTVSTAAVVARSVFAADLDGDGDLDILSASSDDNKIAWYENDGNGSFTTRTVSTAVNAPYGVFAADVDGDGDLDVLSASNNDDTIAWYENRGAPCASCADAYSVNEDTTLVADATSGVLANDGPQQGEMLTAEGATAPSHGTVSLATDGSFTYTPSENYNGTDSFIYRLTSNLQGPRDVVVTLTINSVPDAPIAAGDAYSAESGIPLRATATVVVDPTPRDETLVPFNATWSFMHPTNGQDPAVGDTDFNTTWQLGGAAYNGPAFNPGAAMLGYGTIDYGPIATNIGTPPGGSRFTAYFRGTFELADDPERVVSLSAQLLADDGAVIYLNGQRVGLLNMQQGTNGNYFDRSLSTGSENQTFDVALDPSALVRGTNVLAVSVHNVEPFSSDLGFALRLDARIVPDPDPVGVLVNDSDADGDALVAELVTPPANGSLMLNGDGTFEYTSNAGFVGVDTFEYRANDGVLTSSPATVTITVAPAMNRPPVAVDDAYQVDEDGMLTVDAATGVLANDSDLEQGPLTATVFTAPANGGLTLNADGSFAYTPDADFFGADQFTYRVSDGFLDSAVAIVSITVRPLPDAPISRDDVAATIENYSVAVDVLANDTDPDGEPMTAVIESQPASGTVAIGGNGAIAYLPNRGFIGDDTFTYRATDGVSSSALATVLVTVRDPATLAAGLTGYWPFDGNGADRSGNARDLTLYGGVGFSGGLIGQALEMNGNSSRYAARTVDDAAFDFGGNDFTLQVWVNFDTTSGEQVLIEKFNDSSGPGWTVTKLGGNEIQVFSANSVNSPPLSIAVNVWHHTLVRKRGTLLDVYFDGSPLVVAASFSPLSDTFRPLLIGKRNDGDGRNFTVDGRIDEVAIWDRAVSDEEIAALYNNGFGTPLALCASCADAYAVDEDARLVVNAAGGVLANDAAQPNETLTAGIASPPNHGSLSLAADGSFVYTPYADYFGEDTFTYEIVSDRRDRRRAAVTITVNPRPDVPVAVNDVYATGVGQVLDVTSSPGSADATLIPAGAVWKYLDDGSNQGAAWRENGFDDAAWRSGPAELGYGDGDEATVVRGGAEGRIRPITTYFRRTFSIDNPALVTSLSIDLKRDDGAVVYLNGVEVVRDNMPSGPIDFTTPALQFAPDDGAVFFPFANVDRTPLVRGLNVIAVEIHQNSSTSSDISFDLALNARVRFIRGVLENDVDVDGDSLSLALLAGPFHGALDLRPDGTFTYTPDIGFEGVDQFTYQTTDGVANSKPALVTINVGDANEAPSAGDDRFVAWGGQLVVSATAGVLGNDFDANGDLLEASIFAAPAHGILTLAADGSFTYTPNNNFLGVDTFTYRVTDDSGTFGFATATVHVLRLRDPINAIPLAGDDAYQAQVGAVLEVAAPGVLANDQDAELRAKHAVVDEAPWHGLLSFASDGSFVYTPRPGFSGTDSFTYRATDGNTFSTPATVTINVTGGVPAAPIILGPAPDATTTLPNGISSQGSSSQSTGTIPNADVNGDGRADRADLAAVVALYGTTFGPASFSVTADVDRDGRVSLADAIAVRNAMTAASPSALVRHVTRRPEIRAVDKVFALSVERGVRGVGADLVELSGNSGSLSMPLSAAVIQRTLARRGRR